MSASREEDVGFQQTLVEERRAGESHAASPPPTSKVSGRQKDTFALVGSAVSQGSGLHTRPHTHSWPCPAEAPTTSRLCVSVPPDFFFILFSYFLFLFPYFFLRSGLSDKQTCFILRKKKERKKLEQH